MKCCNREVTTPFCPYCGVRVDQSPLAGLLAHCVTQHSRLLARLETLKSLGSRKQSFSSEELENIPAIITKWNKWVVALQETMKLQEAMKLQETKTAKQKNV